MASVPTTLNEKRKCKTRQGSVRAAQQLRQLGEVHRHLPRLSRVSRFGRRAVRRSDMSGIGREAEVRDLRLKRR
jgi:hypothetical protein